MTSEPVVSLSTSSVYPSSTAVGFECAKRLGYDAVEVMVGTDDASTDVTSVKALANAHAIAVSSVHAPCLLVTQRVWGTDPWVKLHRSAEMALDVGARTVVVHPPFRWQRDYARGFVDGIAQLEEQYDVSFAVENMYPWRTGKREFQAYAPGWNPVQWPYQNVTVDLSHCATALSDPVTMARELGSRLTHVHLADGSGSVKDEHLIPGRGSQPCAEFLAVLAEIGFDGDIVVEVNTRKAADEHARDIDLAEALAFARLHGTRAD